MEYILYKNEYYNQYIKLIKELWDDISSEEITGIIEEHKTSNNKIFLAKDNSKIVGFLNSSIRNDYVEGSNGSPVGYIEGIYISEKYRKQQIARELVNQLSHFYKTINICEIGSDIEIDNKQSDLFHQSIGFTDVGITKHFIKKI